MKLRAALPLMALVLALLACTLTNAPATIATTPTPTATNGNVANYDNAAVIGQWQSIARPLPSATDAPAPTATNGTTRCTVTAYSLNVRSGAGIEYAIIGNVYRGDVLAIATNGDGWQYATAVSGSPAGWINTDYCKEK